jgi:hypothetical protein
MLHVSDANNSFFICFIAFWKLYKENYGLGPSWTDPICLPLYSNRTSYIVLRYERETQWLHKHCIMTFFKVDSANCYSLTSKAWILLISPLSIRVLCNTTQVSSDTDLYCLHILVHNIDLALKTLTTKTSIFT